MDDQEFSFTLILSGVKELSREVLDSLHEAGCDDALVGLRDGVAFADFTRAAGSPEEAIRSAIRDVERAGGGIKVEHIEPDELVSMSEMARRLRLSREGVRKWIGGERGPGKFPAPVAGLKQRSPLWRWTDVLRWYLKYLPAMKGGRVDLSELLPRAEGAADPAPVPGHKASEAEVSAYFEWASRIAAYNAALALRRLVSRDEALKIIRTISDAK